MSIKTLLIISFFSLSFVSTTASAISCSCSKGVMTVTYDNKGNATFSCGVGGELTCSAGSIEG